MSESYQQENQPEDPVNIDEFLSRESENLEENVSQIFQQLGYNLESESFRETPRRFIKFLKEFSKDKEEPRFTLFPATNQNLVIIRDLEIRSMCAHHLAPFFGKCTVAYYPGHSVAGLSKFQRTLDYLCKFPTEQETLNELVIEYLYNKLDPRAIIVMMEAQHTCMIVRGVSIANSTTKTVAVRGANHLLDTVLKYI